MSIVDVTQVTSGATKVTYAMSAGMAPTYTLNAGIVGKEIYSNYNRQYMATTGGDVEAAEKLTETGVLVITPATIRIEFGGATGGEVQYDVGVCAAEMPNTTQAIYNRTYTKIGTYTTNGNEEKEISLQDAETVQKALRYGIVIVGAGNGKSATVTVLQVRVIVQYQSAKAPPVIAFVDDSMASGKWNGLLVQENGKAKWRHRIEDPLTVQLSYTQEMGVAIKGYRVWYTPMDAKAAGDTPTYGEKNVVFEMEKPDENGKITIPTNVWRGLTREWRNSVTQWQYAQIQIWAISNNNILSNMLEMEMWIQLTPHKTTAPERNSIQITNAPVTLEWKQPEEGYQGFVGSVPSGFRLMYSQNEGATWDILTDSIPGTTNKYTMPANTMASGTFYWRVVEKYVGNTYVAPKTGPDGTDWFILKTNPSTSSVSCDGNPMPTVTWTASEQSAYQVRVGTYDSGAIYSTERSHRVPYIFTPGVYAVAVRTQTSSGAWSEWSEEIYATISNTEPAEKITLTAAREGDAIRLTWAKKETYVDYMLYRDDVPIRQTSSDGYMDEMATGDTTYYVRGITTDGYYGQSNAVTIRATPGQDTIYDPEGKTTLQLKYKLSAPVSHVYKKTAAVAYQYFAGREKPIAICTGTTERSVTLQYGAKTKELPQKIETLIGKTVLYRDKMGGMIYGTVESVAVTYGKNIYGIQFAIREVDLNERTPYTVQST